MEACQKVCFYKCKLKSVLWQYLRSLQVPGSPTMDGGRQTRAASWIIVGACCEDIAANTSEDTSKSYCKSDLRSGKPVVQETPGPKTRGQLEAALQCRSLSKRAGKTWIHQGSQSHTHIHSRCTHAGKRGRPRLEASVSVTITSSRGRGEGGKGMGLSEMEIIDSGDS